MTSSTAATTDVVIIGAGIVGLAAAYEASQQGYNVTIVDAAHQGRATDAGAGIVNPLDLTGEQSDAERHRVALFGAGYGHLLAQLSDDGETDHGYACAGQVVVATDEASNTVLERLLARVSGAPSASLDTYVGAVRRIDVEDAIGMAPYLGESVGALLLPGIAHVDGRKLSACLARALERRGVQWRRGVGRILTEDGVVVGVEVDDQTEADGSAEGGIAGGVDGSRIESERVVVASGSWSQALPRWLGDAVAPIRGQIVHLSYPRAPVATVPVVSSVNGPYIVAFEPDHIVTGATHEDVGFDYRVTAGGLAQVLTAALRLAPGLADASMLETRVGFRPVSRDRLPIIGPVPDMAGAVIATGLGAHGLTLGPAAGAAAARMALGGDPGCDVSALAPGRFADRTTEEA